MKECKELVATKVYLICDNNNTKTNVKEIYVTTVSETCYKINTYVVNPYWILKEDFHTRYMILEKLSDARSRNIKS